MYNSVEILFIPDYAIEEAIKYLSINKSYRFWDRSEFCVSNR